MKIQLMDKVVRAFPSLLAVAALVGTGSKALAGDIGGGVPSAGSQSITLTNPLSCDTLGACLDSIVPKLVQIAVPIVAIMVVVGAFQIMTAGGKEEKVTSGRKTLLYAVIGFAIILLATSVRFIIQDVLK
jgi:hypothetical protein